MLRIGLERREGMEEPLGRRHGALLQGASVEARVFLARGLFLGFEALVVDEEDRSVGAQVVEHRTGTLECEGIEELFALGLAFFGELLEEGAFPAFEAGEAGEYSGQRVHAVLVPDELFHRTDDRALELSPARLKARIEG
mgnify:CR=1 FL=1